MKKKISVVITVLFLTFIALPSPVKADQAYKEKTCRKVWKSEAQLITMCVHGEANCPNSDKCTPEQIETAIQCCIRNFPYDDQDSSPSNSSSSSSSSSSSGSRPNTGGSGYSPNNSSSSSRTPNSSSSNSSSSAGGSSSRNGGGGTNSNSRRNVNSAGGNGTTDLTPASYETRDLYGDSICENAQIRIAVSVIGKVVDIIKIAVPIILVLIAIIDITKAIVGQDESKNQKAMQLLVKRVISAIIVFFVIAIVQFVCNLIGTNSTDTTCLEVISQPWKY